MNIRNWLVCIALLLLTWPATITVATARSSDAVAVVVGVDALPHTQASSLKGCQHDARQIGQALEKLGYRVVTLVGPAATREAILAALKSHPSSDLVFYFAGYGSDPNDPRLLTADTQERDGSLQGGLSIKLLDDTLKGLPAGRKTVLLDAGFCPSAAAPGASLTSRYYAPAGGRDIKILVDGQALPGITPEAIQYITAGRYQEPSLEGRLGDQERGVFSYFFEQELRRTAQSWPAVPTDVTTQVVDYAQDRQHPSFPNNFQGLQPGAPAQAADDGHDFLARVGASRQGDGQRSSSAWKVFNTDNRNPQVLRLRMEPNLPQVKVGQYLQFQAGVGRDGYLLIVEHSVEGNFELVYPRDGRAASARVKAGDRVDLPGAGEKVYPSTPGFERLKALLIEDPATAQSLVILLKEQSGSPFKSAAKLLGSREVAFVDDLAVEPGSPQTTPKPDAHVFFTDDLSFEVLP